MMLQSAALGLGAYLVIRQMVMPGALIASSIMMARALAPIETAIANWRTFVLARDSLRRLTQALALERGDEVLEIRRDVVDGGDDREQRPGRGQRRLHCGPSGRGEPE